ncbi:P-loop NTPase fold protein [Plasticicumulans acidivorans]|uniref:KAP-like P-loop domain-containing protein n=1 Tax=Plasticicumulans acidivorans TaxID=886464 RepID=A0A317MWJ7_9GAMM|nr:P-loop NTPase fold protein [Plasticicumulans acidivorans]PWV62354.1 KAP-like P-loop domain-containing protein [Plasticicumulans acidivorans]
MAGPMSLRESLAAAAGSALDAELERVARWAAWLSAMRRGDYHVSFTSLFAALAGSGVEGVVGEQCGALFGDPRRWLAQLIDPPLSDAEWQAVSECTDGYARWPDEDWPGSADTSANTAIPASRTPREPLTASVASLLRFAGNRTREQGRSAVTLTDLTAAFLFDSHGHEQQMVGWGFDLSRLRSEFEARQPGAAAPGESLLASLRCDEDVLFVLRFAVNVALQAGDASPQLTLRHLYYALLEAGDPSSGPLERARALREAVGDGYRSGVGSEVINSSTLPAPGSLAPFSAQETLPPLAAPVPAVLLRARGFAADVSPAALITLLMLAAALHAERAPESAGTRAALGLDAPAARARWLAAIRSGRTGTVDPQVLARWLYGEHLPEAPVYGADIARPARAEDDCLGVLCYARALAATALARPTEPPLAIGVFGDWGSGKSYFMGLMELEMRALAAGGDARFHRHLLSVWFNAWHYADANLWASLMQTLLEALDAHVNVAAQSVDTADLAKLRQALDLAVQFRAEASAASGAAQQALVAAQVASAHQENALAAARQATASREATWVAARRQVVAVGLGRLARDLAAGQAPAAPVAAVAYGIAARARALDLPLLATAAEQVARVTGTAEHGVEQLRGLLSDARVQAARARSGFDWLLSAPLGLRGWQWLGIGAGALVAAALVYRAAVHWLPPGGFPTLGALATLLAGTLTPALAWARRRLAQVRAALDQLDSLRAELDTGLTQAIETDPQVRAAREALEQARAAEAARQAAAEQARQQVEAAERAVADAAEALRSRLRAEQLGDYLRARLASDDYRSRLGLIATIRRDLNTLAVFLQPPAWAAASPGSEAPLKPPSDARAEEIAAVEALRAAGVALRARPVERIVLFVDDLDRCPPERVVEVLEAVHLLLALPLFVVVVGVDVRWVSAALCRRYAGLLAGEGGAHATATPTDYLEKIFQLPFSLPPADPDAAGQLLRGLLGAAVPERTAAVNAPAAEVGTVTPAMPPASGDVAAPVPAAPATAGVAAGAPGAPPLTTRAEVGAALAVSDDEQAFMVRLLGALGGSPRRVRRFVNTYRVYKASLRPAEREELLSSGRYRAVLAALALLVGLADDCPTVRRVLREQREISLPKPHDLRREARNSLQQRPGHQARLDVVLSALALAHDGIEDEVLALADVLAQEDIARFSFTPATRH